MQNGASIASDHVANDSMFVVKAQILFFMKLFEFPSVQCFVLLSGGFVVTAVSSVIIAYIFRSSTSHSSE